LRHEGVPRLQEWFAAPEFSLVDQNAKTFTAADLRGHPWVADFVFTTCGNICPVMSHKMAELQQMTPGGVKLVSFTVNPEHDTPAVLKEYAKDLRADESRWRFLTGTPQQMQDAAKGMHQFDTNQQTDGINHSDKLHVVN